MLHVWNMYLEPTFLLFLVQGKRGVNVIALRGVHIGCAIYSQVPVRHAADRSHRWGTMTSSTEKCCHGFGKIWVISMLFSQDAALVFLDVLMYLPSRKLTLLYLGKRKIIFKYALSGGYVNSLEGIWCNGATTIFCGSWLRCAGPDGTRILGQRGNPSFLNRIRVKTCYSICVAISSEKTQLISKVHYFIMQGINFQPKWMFFSCFFPLALL